MSKPVWVGFAAVVVLLLMVLILSVPLWLLWNWIVPDITRGAVAELTFPQAVGLNFMAAILFGRGTSSGRK